MTHYARGAYFERQVVDLLESQGWFCIRSAGSHGEADIVALQDGEIWLIQCKLDGYLRPVEREQFELAAERSGAVAKVAWRPKRGKIELRGLGDCVK